MILYLRSHGGKQDGIDAAQLHIDLQTEIGEGLWRGLVHILHLYALGRHAQEGVSHPLHLRVHRRLPCSIPDSKITFSGSKTVRLKIRIWIHNLKVPDKESKNNYCTKRVGYPS